MYAIFVQSTRGLNWMGNEPTIERARAVAETQREDETVLFVIVTPVSYFVDADGEPRPD